MVLNTWARGWPGGVARPPRVIVSPARTSTGGRESGLGAISASRVARRSMPTPVTAEPHTTGKTRPWATPWARVASSSAPDRRLALEVALHELVVADDDALDELLAHLVLHRGEVVGDRARTCGLPLS